MGGGKDKSVSDETMVRRDEHEAALNAALAAPTMTRESGAVNRNREEEAIVPLFSRGDCQSLRSRWENLQVGFVDEPWRAVEQADRLVTEAINALAKGFSTQRAGLEQQWRREQEVSTEDLRVAFRRYRSFFERVLSV